MHILLIDNYDSFTFNLVHYIEPMVEKVTVCRNDQIKMADVARFDKIIFSPGPELPQHAGNMLEIMRAYWRDKPMFGVCLGFQGLIQLEGGVLENIHPVRHGQQQTIQILSAKGMFHRMEKEVAVGLYHSWGIQVDNVPFNFEVLAKDSSGFAMGIQHKRLPIAGVQFHPESIMTPEGKKMLHNWITYTP